MKIVEMMKIKHPIILAEWEDIKEFVKKDIKKNKDFYKKLSEM